MCRENFRVAILTEGLFPYEIGGIQKHSYFFAKGLAQKQIAVDVYYGHDGTDPDIELGDYFTKLELQYLNFKRNKFPKTCRFPGHYIYSSFLFSKKLYQEVDKKNYDLVYAQGFTSWYFFKRDSFKNNLISNLHGLEMFQVTINLKNYFQQILLGIPAKKIIRKSALQVSLGGKLTNLLYSKGAKEASVLELSNGIENSWISIKNIDIAKEHIQSVSFIFIGRYERRKGIKELHQVLNEILPHLDFEMVFIGPIPQEKQINHSRVRYLGIIKNPDLIKQHLQKADVLICPSYSEGMPTVILEAMACGCAIIATDVGATNVLVDEENGWLLKGNIVNGLRKAITDATKISKVELVNKKNNSHKKVKNFTWDKIVQKTLNEFKIKSK